MDNGKGGKLKFLVTRATRAIYFGEHNYAEVRGSEIILVAFNKLLSMYEYMRDGKNSGVVYTPQPCDAIGTWVGCKGAKYKSIDRAYKNRDKAALKREIFGSLLEGDVEIFFDEAILGVKSGGIQVGVKYTDWDQLEYGEVKVDYGVEVTESDRIRLKLNMIGVGGNIHSYDCGLICTNGQCSDVPLRLCAGIPWGDSSLALDGELGNVYILAHWMDNSSNLRINSLIQSSIAYMENDTLYINNAILFDVESIKDCSIKIKNVTNARIRMLVQSSMEIDNAYNLRLLEDVCKSSIKFNCYFDNNCWEFTELQSVSNSKFIFTEEVNINTLKKLIKHLYCKSYNKDFMIVVNDSVYEECKKEFNSEYMNYIEKGGE